MKPATRAVQLLPKLHRSIPSAKPLRISCRPTLTPIGLAACKAFSSTRCVANFRDRRKEEFEKLVEENLEKNEHKEKRKDRRWYWGAFAVFCLWNSAYWLQESTEDAAVFMKDRFMPFTIMKREQVSSTAFILTVRPRHGPSNRATIDPYTEDWEKGGWTVRLAHREMQIARIYTPLPPTGPTDMPDELRFLIRRVDGGEVSTYLSKLRVGSEILVQRWHPSAEKNDLRNTKELLFLAGGTGIAPAMQLAYALYEGKQREDGGPKMHIVWANQRSEDCLGGSQGGAFNEGGKMNRIVAELEELRRKHPEQLSIEYMVDEERTFIDERSLQNNIHASPSSSEMEKLIIVCGSDGFTRYIAGTTLDDDHRNGTGMTPTSISRNLGGVLGRINITGWNVVKFP